jgi:hypothetical protein
MKATIINVIHFIKRIGLTLTFSGWILQAASQEVSKMCALTPTELKAKFSSLSANADMKMLKDELTNKGWSKLDVDGTSYGVTGTYRDADGKSTPVEFYVFDYYNKTSKQTGAIIWRNNGKSIYKAYLIFPAGVKDFDKAMEESVEMYVEGGKIQKASSWGRCFKNCIKRNCAGFCVAAATGCLAAAIVIDLAFGGTATGLTLAFWIGCSGVLCGHCFLSCSLNCR